MNEIKLFLNSKLSKLRMSLQVFIVGAVLSATFFLLALDSFKTYHSEILILVNSKSQIALSQQKQLFADIIELPKTLSFYDRMLALNGDVRDVTAGLTQDQRKARWNKMVSVERAKDSSVFKIAITTSREADSKQLVGKAARTLFDVSAFYFNVKDDVDLRIIDGPISKSQFSFWPAWLILSIIFGYLIAIILDVVFSVGKNQLQNGGRFFKKNVFFDFSKKNEVSPEEEIESLRNLYQSELGESPFSFEENDLENEIRFQEMKKLTKQMESDKYPNYAEMPIRERQQEVVPDNLPIADDSYFIAQEKTSQNAQEKTEEISEAAAVEPVKREPTEAEMRERLNQLLRGEF